MEPLARLDSNSILAEDIFLEIFDQEDEIMKARMILSLTDRAAELGVKKKFEELLKAYKKGGPGGKAAGAQEADSYVG